MSRRRLAPGDMFARQLTLPQKMAGKVSVSGTSLSFTLPMCCQICLGKVKEPVVCPNQHVFCATCMDAWLVSHHCCPTCRTPITTEEPCKKILGSLDLPMNSDSLTRVELRRTRLELIRQEYEDEISTLQNTTERLRSENKDLHKKISDKEKTLSAFQLAGSENSDGSKVDICMLVNLTSKLQEASINCELLHKDIMKLKEENRRLRDDNEALSRENTRLKDESLFNKSPQRYGRYSMTGLQTKVNQYEREVQQLKRALSKSDTYIEELTAKLNKGAAQKTTTRNKATRSSLPSTASTSTVTTLSPQTKDTDGRAREFPARPSSAPGHVYSSLTSNSNLESRGDEKGGLQGSSQTNLFSGDDSQDLGGSPGCSVDGMSEQSPSLGGDLFDTPKDVSLKKPQKRLMEEDLNVFTASRKLMQLSENLNRKRGGDPLDNSRVHTEAVSPCSSESGGRGVTARPLDLDMLVEVASSPQIPVNEVETQASSAPRDEIVSNTSSSEDSTEVLNTFSLAKIKTEISTPCEEPACPLKKVKLEKVDATELEG